MALGAFSNLEGVDVPLLLLISCNVVVVAILVLGGQLKRLADNDFAEHVRSLPPELFDMIYDYTFTAQASVCQVTEDYKPSHRLVVDRASRDKFAQSFYANTTFFFGPQRKLAWTVLTLESTAGPIALCLRKALDIELRYERNIRFSERWSITLGSFPVLSWGWFDTVDGACGS